jgi:tight adherence protein C
MQKGQPLEISALLPFGMTGEDVLLLLLVGAIMLIVWSLGQIVFERDRLGPRLKMIAERRAELKGQATGTRRRKQHAKHDHLTFMRRIVAELKLLQQHQVDVLQQKLIQAGYRSKDAIIIYAFAKLVMPFAGLGLGALVSGMDWANAFSLDELWGWVIILSSGYLGARLPDILVANGRAKRHHAIRKALPDALDLMMICAEAGLSLAAALDRVAHELARVSPELSEELTLTSVELGFLPERATALRHLAERCDLKEIRGFVNVIAQTEKYGTPIAQALRVLAQEFRTERMLRAEQKAARLPALMTVPMIAFILPVLFIVIMAPAVISVMDNW